MSTFNSLQEDKFNKICHVGLPKTGTSFLQKYFFPKIFRDFFCTYQFNIWPYELNWIYLINNAWLTDLVKNKSLFERKYREKIFKKRILSCIKKWQSDSFKWSQSKTESFMISAEGLVGLSLPAATCMANLLLGAGVNKIIFVFRQQAPWSYSLWSQMVLKEDRFARFIPYHDLFGVEPNPVHDSIVDMDWSSYLKMYQGIFGNANVLALPYELLLKKPEIFYKNIQQFMRLDHLNISTSSEVENPSLKTNSYTAWRVDNNTLMLKMPSLRLKLHYYLTPCVKKSALLSKLLLKEVKVENMPEELKRKIMQNFETSNRELAELSGFNLEEFGYY